ncbi:MAG: FtsQ-type POTRA domain-containing protein [Opitutales bacterium]|nr:FtsQ-type POTRA domain-containing protein [Opitutales bacterium]
MKKNSRNPSNARSWRDLQTNNRRFKDTDAARERRWALLFRATGACLVLLAFCVVGLGGYYWIQQLDEPVVRSADAGHRVEQLDWESNGVLQRDWFYRNFPEVASSSMARIDVHQLKERLEHHGQIIEAHVTLRFPRTLKIELSEREPVLRARVRGENNQPKTVLIARDGTVYEGDGYPRSTLQRLPGVTGVSLRHDGRRYLPLDDIAPVAALLDKARDTMPGIYRNWAVVSLASYEASRERPLRLIEVVDRSGGRIVFAPGQYDEQLGRLQRILNLSDERQMGRPSRIDLSFRNEAVVQY